MTAGVFVLLAGPIWLELAAAGCSLAGAGQSTLAERLTWPAHGAAGPAARSGHSFPPGAQIHSAFTGPVARSNARGSRLKPPTSHTHASRWSARSATASRLLPLEHPTNSPSEVLLADKHHQSTVKYFTAHNGVIPRGAVSLPDVSSLPKVALRPCMLLVLMAILQNHRLPISHAAARLDCAQGAPGRQGALSPGSSLLLHRRPCAARPRRPLVARGLYSADRLQSDNEPHAPRRRQLVHGELESRARGHGKPR